MRFCACAVNLQQIRRPKLCTLIHWSSFLVIPCPWWKTHWLQWNHADYKASQWKISLIGGWLYATRLPAQTSFCWVSIFSLWINSLDSSLQMFYVAVFPQSHFSCSCICGWAVHPPKWLSTIVGVLHNMYRAEETKWSFPGHVQSTASSASMHLC